MNEFLVRCQALLAPRRAAQIAQMSQSNFRQYRDSRGLDWRVWAVVPSESNADVLARADAVEPTGNAARDAAAVERMEVLRQRRARWTSGWLLFESAEGRRRLRPIPPDWNTASPAQLEEMCGRAQPVPPEGSGSSSGSRAR